MLISRSRGIVLANAAASSNSAAHVVSPPPLKYRYSTRIAALRHVADDVDAIDRPTSAAVGREVHVPPGVVEDRVWVLVLRFPRRPVPADRPPVDCSTPPIRFQDRDPRAVARRIVGRLIQAVGDEPVAVAG